MGRLVVVEGLDGAGKRTLTEALTASLRDAGASVAGIAFPRYGTSVHADLVADALHGRVGDLGESVHGMALLFALDRLGARNDLLGLLAHNDVVLADRYVASNAAYGAARLHQGGAGEFVAWVRALEIDRFALPVPHTHLLLRVPVEVAAGRAAHREDAESRARDSFESDGGLQARCARVYDELAHANWLAPWQVVDGTRSPDAALLAKTVLR